MQRRAGGCGDTRWTQGTNDLPGFGPRPGTGNPDRRHGGLAVDVPVRSRARIGLRQRYSTRSGARSLGGGRRGDTILVPGVTLESSRSKLMSEGRADDGEAKGAATSGAVIGG